jgi:hypothetical protein
LEELRSFRHETVHNGFRYLDHAPEQLVLFESLAALAAHAAQRCTELAIIQGLTTGGDLVRYLPILLETHLGAVATASRTMEAVSTILTERPT